MSIWRFCRDTAGSALDEDEADTGVIGDMPDDDGKLLSAADDGPLPLGLMADRSEKSGALCSSKPCAWCESEE